MLLKGITCGTVFFGVFKLLYKIISILIYVLANILVYFGLWIPFFYMLFSGGLMLWGGLDISVPSVNANLFKFGLGLSLACAVIISIRSLLFKPIGQIINIRRGDSNFEDNKNRKRAKRRAERYYKDDEGAFVNNSIDYYNSPYHRDPPTIYRSAKDRQLIVHEFRDRFELFRVFDGKLVLVDIKYKGSSPQRK